ncbi:7421_t:CDS:2 [Dentiscutata erythropus]|uniref:7421_t:CDS:1 n=1 Tax=Dentiscutata erythropus TaxID=1348616 RepID=A0A9N9B224_9GLOM|nr:7421_t:CDS:2 [Dentiscutata erythropus]
MAFIKFFEINTFTKFFDDLSNELSNIFEDSDDYDVIIQAGKEPDFKEFKAHSVILRARSPYFKVALSDKWMKNKESISYFSKPNISPAVFHLILRYIYTGTLDLKDQPGSNIFALLIAADELLLDRLVDHVQRYLINKEIDWIKKNLVIIIPTVFKIQRFKQIQDYITGALDLSINSESDLYALLNVVDELAPDELFNRISEHLIKTKPSWLKENIINILFNITELKRCDKVQDEKFVNTDITSWKENEFSAFKEYIDPFIPYVRFCEISRAEFYHHVMPFKKVLPKDLYKDLKVYFFADIKPQQVNLQPRGKIDSTIIKKENARDIIKWVMKTDVILKKTSYEFILSYRATRNGFDSKELITRLKSSSKVKNSDSIIGGYIKDLLIYSRTDRAEGFFIYFGNGKDSNLHEPCKIEFQFQSDASSVDFGCGRLKLLGQNGTCSMLGRSNFIAEEIEIFNIKINN